MSVNGTTQRHSEATRCAELAVLGGIIRDNSVIGDVAGQLDAKDFSADAHRKIFAVILFLFQGGKSADLVTIADVLDQRGQIEDIGGHAYLAELWEVAPTATGTAQHVGIVREHALLRRLRRAGEQIAHDAESRSGSAGDLLVAAENRIASLIASGPSRKARAILSPPSQSDSLTAAELVGIELPPARFLLPGIVPDGLTLFAGKPKLGKSWLALLIALAVAFGGEALGQQAGAGKVVYLALEDTRRRLQLRLRKLLSAWQSTAPAGLHLRTKIPRQDRGGLAVLCEWMDDHPSTRLIIVDTWQKFRPASIRNSQNCYEQDYEAAGEVKALADRYGIGVLALHHCRKLDAEDPLDTISGTLGLSGCADAALVMRRVRGQADASLFVTGRDVEEQELALRWDKTYCLWTAVGDAEECRLSKERQDILDCVRGSTWPVTPQEAAERLGKNRSTVKSLMWRLAQDGWLEQAGKGAYVATACDPGQEG